MIAALEWVPEGRANPTPSKYEYSRAEQEFMSRVIAQHEDNNDVVVANDDGKDGSVTDANKDNDEEWEDMSDDEEDTAGDEKKKVELPKVDPSSLPSDLNMDDYSDDDDKDNNEEKMGDLLGIGKVCN